MIGRSLPTVVPETVAIFATYIFVWQPINGWYILYGTFPRVPSFFFELCEKLKDLTTKRGYPSRYGTPFNPKPNEATRGYACPLGALIALACRETCAKMRFAPWVFGCQGLLSTYGNKNTKQVVVSTKFQVCVSQRVHIPMSTNENKNGFKTSPRQTGIMGSPRQTGIMGDLCDITWVCIGHWLYAYSLVLSTFLKHVP